MPVSDKKTEKIKQIKDEIAKTNFDRATALQSEAGLDPSELNSIAATVFAELLERKKFESAIAIGQQYRLPEERIAEATVKNYTALFASGEYEKAVQWGLDHSLESSEIVKAAIKMVERAIRNHQYNTAIEIKEKFKIPEEQVRSIVLFGFNTAHQKRDFYSAAILAKHFDFPAQRLVMVTAKGFIDAIIKRDLNAIVNFEKTFNLLSDSMFNEMQDIEQERVVDLFKTKIIETHKDKPETIVKLMNEIGFLSRPHKNIYLAELQISIHKYLAFIHGGYLQKDEIDKAIDLVQRFDLYDEVPGEVKDAILEAAVNYHDKLLTGYNYSKAKRIKEKYTELFKTSSFGESTSGQGASVKFFEEALKKGDIKIAMKMAQDYNLSKEQITNSASDSLAAALDKGNFDEAIELLHTFKLNPDNEKILTAARKQFNRALQNNLNDLAADLGYYFKMEKHSTREAAFQSWQRMLRSGKYDQALEIYKKHRLPKKTIEPVLKEVYQYNIDIGQAERALKLRKDYKIAVGIMSLIKEVLQKLGIFRK